MASLSALKGRDRLSTPPAFQAFSVEVREDLIEEIVAHSSEVRKAQVGLVRGHQHPHPAVLWVPLPIEPTPLLQPPYHPNHGRLRASQTLTELLRGQGSPGLEEHHQGTCLGGRDRQVPVVQGGSRLAVLGGHEASKLQEELGLFPSN